MIDKDSQDPLETTGHTSEFDQIVLRCEQAWQRGERPQIDEVIRTAGQQVDTFALLVELIHLELEKRLAAGELARVKEYLERYPRLRDEQSAMVGLIRTEYKMRRKKEPGLASDSSLDASAFESANPGSPRNTAGRLAWR